MENVLPYFFESWYLWCTDKVLFDDCIDISIKVCATVRWRRCRTWLRLYLAKKNSYSPESSLSSLIQSTKGTWEKTIPYGLFNDGLKPVLFVSFEISPPDRASTQELWDCVARVTSHSAFPLSPWARMVFRAYSERALLVTRAEMWWWYVREGETNGYTWFYMNLDLEK